ncbi:MAG: ribosome small subunit-dependent GTPase A [Chitinophagaceae bacterium]|nr:ribosome small subunit-dependent GTPase A [Chitinophagaceae bacterium]
MEGLVYKSTGSWYIVKTTGGEVYNARIKGRFKIDADITSTNPVTVGDIISFEPEEEDARTAIITSIHARRNYINRQSPSHKHLHHIIAANVDQILLICTLKEPRTSQGFIDRFLITAEAYHIPAILLFNKSDLYRKKEAEKYDQWREMYEAIGYKVLLTSIAKNEGADAVAEALKDKATLVSGHSGVGKSSFINRLVPSFALKTQEVSGWSGKGLHTTTFAEMYDLPGGGRIIDTPGIREFGLVDISRQELSHYFPEMRDVLPQCQFNNCLHTNEPGCAVKEAVAAGKINEDRYVSYYNILESIGGKHY